MIHIRQAPPDDTMRRARDLEALQIHLLDCTLPEDSTTASITVGGNRFAFNDILPLLQVMAPDASYNYGGRTGAGIPRHKAWRKTIQLNLSYTPTTRIPTKTKRA